MFFVFGIGSLVSYDSTGPTSKEEVANTTVGKKNSVVPLQEKPLDTENINTNIDSKKEQNEKGTVVSVADGDTLRVSVNGSELNVRLIGIDTPEINHQSEPVQCFGPEAAEALKDLVLDKEVVLEKDVSDKDTYDRYLRYIWIDETMVNEYLTRNGYAFSSSYPPDTKYQKRLAAGQAYASKNLIGLWGPETCNGDVYTGTYKDPNLNTEVDTTSGTEGFTESQQTQLLKEDLPPDPDSVASPLYITPVVTPAPLPSDPTPSESGSSSYGCSCSKTCSNMSSCEEAYFQLNTCGCSARDRDNDGVPCESICR